MELEKIKELIDMMKANDLNELEIVDGQTRIMLKRGPGEQAVQQVVAMPSVISPGVPVAAAPAADSSGEKQQNAGLSTDGSEGEKLLEITSPIVGTFYSTPSPNADTFVEVGSHVDEESVVCIIEAMKVMNEIKSEVKGTIRKILVDNGQALEYGQPMFLLEAE